MRKTLLVAKYEATSLLLKPSFWLVSFVLPIVILALNMGTQIVANRVPEAVDKGPGSGDAGMVWGYVDPSGIISELPPDVTSDALARYIDVDTAQADMDHGVIAAFFEVDPDYVENGRVVVHDDKLSAASVGGWSTLEYVMNYALTKEASLARAISQGAPVSIELIEPKPSEADASGQARVVLYGALMILFFVLTFSSSMLLQTVAREKENRTVEVLLVSLHPRQVMVGKVLGMGLLALLQMGIWLGGARLVLAREMSGIDIGIGGLPAGAIAWYIVYFALGYITYATAMSALGAMAPSVREAGQFTFVVLLPLMLPLWFNYQITSQPNGPLATALSLFPLSAPVTMPARLLVADVPIWQPLLGVAGLAATAYGMVSLGGRMFRADTLLSLQSLNWKRILGEVRGKQAS